MIRCVVKPFRREMQAINRDVALVEPLQWKPGSSASSTRARVSACSCSAFSRAPGSCSWRLGVWRARLHRVAANKGDCHPHGARRRTRSRDQDGPSTGDATRRSRPDHRRGSKPSDESIAPLASCGIPRRTIRQRSRRFCGSLRWRTGLLDTRTPRRSRRADGCAQA